MLHRVWQKAVAQYYRFITLFPLKPLLERPVSSFLILIVYYVTVDQGNYKFS